MRAQLADPTSPPRICACRAEARRLRAVGLAMTEVVLLVVAGVLIAACGVFVAAEFSLTTVEKGRRAGGGRG